MYYATGSVVVVPDFSVSFSVMSQPKRWTEIPSGPRANANFVEFLALFNLALSGSLKWWAPGHCFNPHIGSVRPGYARFLSVLNTSIEMSGKTQPSIHYYFVYLQYIDLCWFISYQLSVHVVILLFRNIKLYIAFVNQTLFHA